MPEDGEPSRVMDEEPRDIHVVFESPLVVEPVTVVAPAEEEYEPESDPEEDEEEPVDSDPIDDPDEVPHDGTTFEDELLGQYADRIIRLDDKVHELKTEAQEQRARVQELEAEIAARQEAETQLGAMVHHLLARNVELVGRLEQSEQRELSDKAEKEALRAQIELEVMDRIHYEELWEDARDRADDLESEVRCKRRKMNRMGYAFRTAMERWVDGVYHYPVEEGQTRHTLSRDLMAHMGQLEYESAVERGMLG